MHSSQMLQMLRACQLCGSALKASILRANSAFCDQAIILLTLVSPSSVLLHQKQGSKFCASALTPEISCCVQPLYRPGHNITTSIPCR